MKTKELNVSLDFRYGKVSKTQSVAALVSEMMYISANFPNPPVPKVDLDAERDELDDALVACANGGPIATAHKNTCLEAVRTSLKKQALYVNICCDNVLETLLASGFEPTGSKSARTPLANPTTVTLANADIGRMSLKTPPIRNGIMYEGQHALVSAEGVTGPWSASTMSTKCKVEFRDLVSGAMHIFRMRVLGGLDGYTEWTPTVTGRCL